MTISAAFPYSFPRSHFHSGAYLGLVGQGEGAEGRRPDGVRECGPGRAALGLGQERVGVGIELGLMEKEERGDGGDEARVPA